MRQELFSVPITVGDRESVIEECRALVGTGGVVFTANALMLERARKEPAFARTLASADVVSVDGVGVLRALEKAGVKSELLPGVELGEIILSEGAPSLAVIGGREGVAELAFSYLKVRNPRIRQSFVISGYGHSEEEYLALLRRHRPKICLVCLGSPRQEFFSLSASRESPKTLFLSLGGSLDIYSGRLRRAPKGMRALHLEWLYRMAREPRRFAALPRLLSFAIASHREKGAKNQQKSHIAEG